MLKQVDLLLDVQEHPNMQTSPIYRISFCVQHLLKSTNPAQTPSPGCRSAARGTGPSCRGDGREPPRAPGEISAPPPQILERCVIPTRPCQGHGVGRGSQGHGVRRVLGQKEMHLHGGHRDKTTGFMQRPVSVSSC